MPNRDGTGPFGDGRLGRGLGNCRSSNSYYTNSGSTNRASRFNLLGFGAELLYSALYKLIDRKAITKRR